MVLVLAAWLAGRLIGVHGLPFVVLVQILLMRWALLLLQETRPALRNDWFRVRPWEPGTYRWFGIYGFMLLLRALGWERFRREAQGFDGTRKSLVRYERMTREAEYSHLLLLLICVVPLLTAIVLRAWDTAMWVMVSTVLLHAYPVMLQRTLRARLQRLIVGAGSAG